MTKSWTDQDLIAESVTHSNALAHIIDIDMKDPKNLQPLKGHYGALLQAFQNGRRHLMVSGQDLERWHQWILDEQEEHGLGVPRLPVKKKAQMVFLQTLQNRLQSARPSIDEVNLVNLIADTIHDFLSHKIFPTGNGRIARLLVNYLCAWGLHPPIVFHESEKQELKQSETDENRLRLYIAKKLRESIYNQQGQLLHFASGTLLNATFVGKDGKKLIVQWNDLSREEMKWLLGI